MTETVLITGASSGLGRGMAVDLAGRGRDLVVTARRADRLEDLRRDIETRYPGRRVVPLTMDVTDAKSVSAAFEQAVAAVGTLDRIVVNAGLGKGARIGAGKPDANRETAMTNFVGGITQCEAAMQVLYGQGRGQIAVISSIVSERGMAGPMNVYAASKAGLDRLTEGIRSDVQARRLPIVVTAIRPGYIASEMQDRRGHQHPLMVSTERGCSAMVDAILGERRSATVPGWPWAPFGLALRHAPLALVRRMV